ncbi:MAG: type IV secretion system DNA-binding domain-containing protein [Phycisphaerales bacterium]|nr:type IV secretion system DNA-binding domain-containing protein [Phycisphaerales bacterium]
MQEYKEFFWWLVDGFMRAKNYIASVLSPKDFAIIFFFSLIVIIYFILKNRAKINIPLIRINTTEKKANIKGVIIDDVFAGIYIGGAAGSGKTRAVLVPLMQHFREHNFSNIVYCYKDDELIKYGLTNLNGFAEEGKTFEDERKTKEFFIYAPMTPEYTDKINLLEESYFSNLGELKSFFIQLIQKTQDKTTEKGNSFFTEATVGMLTGVAILFIEEAKKNKEFKDKYCSLPVMIAMINEVGNLDQLKKIIATNSKAKSQAGSFIVATKETLTSIGATVQNFIGKFANEPVFYSLYDAVGVYKTLDINEKQKTIYLLNNMAHEKVALPIINSVMELIISFAMRTDIKKSVPTSLIVDEGSTINLEGFSRKPATMRSRKIATIFMIQDLSLAEEQSNNVTPRAIISNLSCQFIGKINDSATGDYYEKLFDYIEKDQYSYSTKGTIIQTSQGTNKSKKEQKEFRTPDLFQLKTGEFISFTGGKAKKNTFDYKNVSEFKATEEKLVKQNINKIVADTYEEITKRGIEAGKYFSDSIVETQPKAVNLMQDDD